MRRKCGAGEAQRVEGATGGARAGAADAGGGGGRVENGVVFDRVPLFDYFKIDLNPVPLLGVLGTPVKKWTLGSPNSTWREAALTDWRHALLTSWFDETV